MLGMKKHMKYTFIIMYQVWASLFTVSPTVCQKTSAGFRRRFRISHRIQVFVKDLQSGKPAIVPKSETIHGGFLKWVPPNRPF